MGGEIVFSAQILGEEGHRLDQLFEGAGCGNLNPHFQASCHVLDIFWV